MTHVIVHAHSRRLPDMIANGKPLMNPPKAVESIGLVLVMLLPLVHHRYLHLHSPQPRLMLLT